MSNVKKALLLFAILTALVAIDVAGYILIEHVSAANALYMTVISITTVGYNEVFPLSEQGRMFTIWVIVSGLGTFFYIATKMAENIFEGNIRRILGRRKLKMIGKLKDHVIVAGYGIMGEHVCRELEHRKIKFIVLESSQDRFANAEELGYNVLLGDATNEEALAKAGIEKARTFISLLSSDADNIYTVMAVREMNANICIIARAQDAANEKRLYKVGSNRVIAPYELGSRRIVNTVLRPNVVEFLDVMTYSPKMDLSIEEFTISDSSPFANKQIKDSGLRQNYNTMVIAIKREEEMFFNPSGELEIKANDILILVGEKEKLLSLN